MGWGGVIASAVAGGVSGAAQAGVDDIVEQQKQAALRLRDQSLAELQRGTYAANKQVDIAAIGPEADAKAAAASRNAGTLGAAKGAEDLAAFNGGDQQVMESKGSFDTAQKQALEAAKPVPPGYAIRTGTDENGNPTWQQSPNKYGDAYVDALTQDKLADAAKKQAEAAAVGTKGGKTLVPNIMNAEGAPGYVMDKTSGALGRIVPYQEGTPAQKNLIFPDTPGTPAVQHSIEWTKDGKPVKLDDLYAQLQKNEDAAADYKAAKTGDQASRTPAARGIVDSGSQDPNNLPPLANPAAFQQAVKDYYAETAKDNPDPAKIAQYQQQIRTLNSQYASTSAGATPQTASPTPTSPGTPQYGPPMRDPKTGVTAHKNLLTGKWERM
jgi:hypothetical protein